MNEEQKKKLQEIREKKQAEAVEVIKANNYNGLVNIVMRYGKTFIGINSIASLAKRRGTPINVLWVTDGVDLRDKKLPLEFKVAGKESLLSTTKFICWSSLNKEIGEYDFIILDEYQFITVGNSVNLFNDKLKGDHILGLTGTAPRGYMKQKLLGKLGLKEIIEVKIDEAIDDKILSDYRVTVLKFNLDNIDPYIQDSKGNMITERIKYDRLTYVIDQKREEGWDFGAIAGVRMKLLYGSKVRKAVITKLKKYLDSKGKRGLIFTPFKKSAEELGSHFHSSSSASYYNDFQDKKINSLALVKSGGVGHTYEDLNYIVIGNPTRDYTGITTQNFGRGLMYKEGGPIDIYFICSVDTVEESNWLPEALRSLDPSKITYSSMASVISK